MINVKWIEESNLPNYEIEYLLNNLCIFFQSNHDRHLMKKLLKLKSYYKIKEGNEIASFKFSYYFPDSIKKIV